MKKKQNIIYIALGALVIWYLYKKQKPVTAPGASSPAGSGNLATAANELAAQEVKNINFVPDMSTMADEYKKDQKNCK